MTSEGDPSEGRLPVPYYGAPKYPYPQTGPTSVGGTADDETIALSDIAKQLIAAGVITEDDVADFDAIELYGLWQDWKKTGSGATGSVAGPNVGLLQFENLLNPTLIDLTSQGLPGRAILRGTDTIIDMRTPGQFKQTSIPGVYYDQVSGEAYDNNGNLLAKERLGLDREQLALDAELGRGQLGVSQGNLAVNQGQLALSDQEQAFSQQYRFPEEQRQFNTSTTQNYDLAGDTNRRLAASDVLGNAVQLQGIQDQRGYTAARLAADPGNFVEREYVSRGLAAPQQGQAPLFRDVPQVQQGFSALQNYQPTRAPQLSSVAPGTVLPTSSLLPKPAIPAVVPVPKPPIPTPVPTPQPASSMYTSTNPLSLNADPWSQATQDYHNQLVSEGAVVNADPQYTPTNYNYDPSGGVDSTDQYNFEIRDGSLVAVPQYAHGGVTTASQMIVGDPQRSGQPNPELVEVPPGTPTRVTPLNRLPSQALSNANSHSAVQRGLPTKRPVPMYGDGTEDPDAAPRGNLDVATVVTLMSAMARQSPYDDNIVDTTMVEDRRPSLRSIPANQQVFGQYNPRGRIPEFAYGTDPFDYGDYTQQFSDVFNLDSRGVAATPSTSTMPPGTVSQPSANPTTHINTDESIQQLPTLEYLKGTMDRGTYGTLNTGTSSGAFGTSLPEAGAINFSKIMQISQDPVAMKLLDSLYRSASRSLSAEVERARARAPIGNAPVSSLVRT